MPSRGQRGRRARALLVASVAVVLVAAAGALLTVPRLLVRPAAVTGLPPSALAAVAASRGSVEEVVPAAPPGYHPLPALPPPAPASTAPARVAGTSPAAPGPVTSAPTSPTAAAIPAPSPAPVAARADAGLPLRVPVGSSTQVVTVVAASGGSSTARLQAWERRAGEWTSVLGPVTARVGAGGIGAASETSTRTPAGTFSLTEAFGRLPDPGTELPYRVIDRQDWWVSDPASASYNQHVRCPAGSCRFDEAAGENLWSEGAVYNEAVVIDYNRAGVRGAGSAYFLHVSNGAPTAGCVAIDQASLTALLRWLDPDAHPLISIGVG